MLYDVEMLVLKFKGDTYLRAYKKYREDRLQEVIDLKRELNDLKRMVEWLCHEVMKDEDD